MGRMISPFNAVLDGHDGPGGFTLVHAGKQFFESVTWQHLDVIPVEKAGCLFVKTSCSSLNGYSVHLIHYFVQ